MPERAVLSQSQFSPLLGHYKEYICSKMDLDNDPDIKELELSFADISFQDDEQQGECLQFLK